MKLGSGWKSWIDHSQIIYREFLNPLLMCWNFRSLSIDTWLSVTICHWMKCKFVDYRMMINWFLMIDTEDEIIYLQWLMMIVIALEVWTWHASHVMHIGIAQLWYFRMLTDCNIMVRRWSCSTSYLGFWVAFAWRLTR